jgi:hypothetical protein
MLIEACKFGDAAALDVYDSSNKRSNINKQLSHASSQV